MPQGGMEGVCRWSSLYEPDGFRINPIDQMDATVLSGEASLGGVYYSH